jgi:hypothetical protein
MTEEISMAERRRILAEELRFKTYMAHTDTFLDDNRGGRFSVTKPAALIGSGPIHYPQLPQDAPANQALMVGDEMPLGYDINAMDAVGEPHEVKASEVKKAAWRRI